MAQGTATSFAVPNFSGMLFAKGQQVLYDRRINMAGRSVIVAVGERF